MNIEQILKKYILNELMFEQDESLLPSDTPLLEKGIIDSMHLLQLIQFIEEQFNVTVSDGDLIPDNFQSVDRLKEFVLSKLRQAS